MPGLRLAALDEEDLAVLSAHLQDAVLRLGDIEWSPSARRLLLPVNRFVWETAGGLFKRTFERRRAVLHLDRVTAVKSSRVAQGNKDSVLSILAVTFLPGDAPSGTVAITLAGGGEIRATVECVEARLTDLSSGWATTMKPRHRG